MIENKDQLQNYIKSDLSVSPSLVIKFTLLNFIVFFILKSAMKYIGKKNIYLISCYYRFKGRNCHYNNNIQLFLSLPGSNIIDMVIVELTIDVGNK